MSRRLTADQEVYTLTASVAEAFIRREEHALGTAPTVHPEMATRSVDREVAEVGNHQAAETMQLTLQCQMTTARCP